MQEHLTCPIPFYAALFLSNVLITYESILILTQNHMSNFNKSQIRPYNA